MGKFIVLGIFFLLLIGMVNVIAQIPNAEEENLIGREYRPDKSNLGSPYFVDEWAGAKVDFISGKSKSDLQIKYDGFHDELIYFNANRRIMIEIEKSTIKNFSFSLGGHQYNFERMQVDGIQNEGHFFQVLYSGSVGLICRRKVELVKDQAGASGKMVYQRVPQYYLQNSHIGFQQIRLSKKAFLHSIKKEKLNAVKKLIRANYLKFKKEMQFANSLQVIDKNIEGFWQD